MILLLLHEIKTIIMSFECLLWIENGTNLTFKVAVNVHQRDGIYKRHIVHKSTMGQIVRVAHFMVSTIFWFF